ncbi:MAG: hypothetical protein OIF32_10795, partial [Campylobacterales bacterium]|nr:hypothetical protein [Campylobacterales bacterium]
HVKLGLALANQTLLIKDKKTEKITLAKMEGDLTPAPYYGVSTKKSFFGDSNFGYEFGFAYSNSYALNQKVDENSQKDDFGTYSAISMVTFSPTAFYGYGINDSTPDQFVSIGVGLGVGYTTVKGTTYLTEDPDASADCKNAVNGYKKGDKSAMETIKNQCTQIEYNDSGFGLSSRVFIEGRYGNFYGSFDVGAIQLKENEDYHLEPATQVLTFAYVIDLN